MGCEGRPHPACGSLSPAGGRGVWWDVWGPRRASLPIPPLLRKEGQKRCVVGGQTRCFVGLFVGLLAGLFRGRCCREWWQAVVPGLGVLEAELAVLALQVYAEAQHAPLRIERAIGFSVGDAEAGVEFDAAARE